ncbi:MAG: hypothetical protein Q9199_001045 [Rusavskia elegans]
MAPPLGAMGPSLPSRIWILLFLFCSSLPFVANAFQMPEPFYVSRDPPILMINETGPLLASASNEPHSFGIQFHPGTVPILPQAVGGIISQALYKAYIELGSAPLQGTRNFEHLYSEAAFARVCFDVGVTITATETRPGVYMMTNERIATILSLMGFDFSHQDNLVDLREYQFDVIVSNPENTTIIGHGSLRNTKPINKPYRVGDRLYSCGFGAVRASS